MRRRSCFWQGRAKTCPGMTCWYDEGYFPMWYISNFKCFPGNLPRPPLFINNTNYSSFLNIHTFNMAPKKKTKPKNGCSDLAFSHKSKYFLFANSCGCGKDDDSRCLSSYPPLDTLHAVARSHGFHYWTLGTGH